MWIKITVENKYSGTPLSVFHFLLGISPSYFVVFLRYLCASFVSWYPLAPPSGTATIVAEELAEAMQPRSQQRRRDYTRSL